MFRSALLLLATLAVLSMSLASADHPPANIDCSGKDGPATPMSYHIHIVFMTTDKAQMQRASDLRDRVYKQFAEYIGEDCPDRYDNARLCFIYDHKLDFAGVGPFPVGEWSMYVPTYMYGAVVPWFVQNRGEFSLLVHPNTGCENEDHGDWAMWSGRVWPLRMDIFSPHEQTESWGHHAGDKENPLCAKAQTVCGTSDFGPTMGCCRGLNCDCPDGEKCTCVRKADNLVNFLNNAMKAF